MHKLLNVLLFVGLIQLAYSQCPYAYSSDGYIYDLTDLSTNIQVFQYEAGGSMYHFNVSICRPSPYGCAGQCRDSYTAGVCQAWGPGPQNAKCFGQYQYADVIGLRYGQGVQITYFGGDICGACSPSGPRSTVVTLSCGSPDIDPTLVKWTSHGGVFPGQPPIEYLNGTISCQTYYNPISAPYSSSPQPTWGPSGSNPNQHVTIKYYGTNTDCNRDNSYMIVVNRTASCTPSCRSMGNTFVQTDCDTDLYLPAAQTWIEKTNYGNNYDCETPQYAIYTLPDQCSGALSFSYQECDVDAVYTYSCPNARCTGCTLRSKMPNNMCSYGTQYQCITTNNRQSDYYPNPLF